MTPTKEDMEEVEKQVQDMLGNYPGPFSHEEWFEIRDRVKSALLARDAKARAEERERCAKVCDNASVIEFAKGMQTNDEVRMALRLAKALRGERT